MYFRGTPPEAHAGLLRTMDVAALRVAADVGIDWPKPTRVVVCGSLEDFRAALPAGVRLPASVVGVAIAPHNLIIVRNHARIRQTFVHEASHIALLHATRGVRLPRWFIEGFASFQAAEGSFGRLASLVRASVSGSVIPLRELERHFPSDHQAADLAYAQSAELISYLLATYGRRLFHQLVRRIKEKEPFFKSLARTYGKPLDEIEDAYLRDLRVRYNWIPIIAGPTVLWIAITLVFIAAFLRKRREARRRLAEMADEDPFEPPPWEEDEDETPPPPPTLH